MGEIGSASGISSLLYNQQEFLQSKQQQAYSNLQNAAESYYGFVTSQIAEIQNKINDTIQKTGKFLIDLRSEIQEWHGDVLK